MHIKALWQMRLYRGSYFDGTDNCPLCLGTSGAIWLLQYEEKVMGNPGWKKFERRIAIQIEGRRTGILGGEDIEHPIFSGECKLLQELPKWLRDVYGQAVRNCSKGKIPFACVKQKGKNDKNALVILNFMDFKELINK